MGAEAEVGGEVEGVPVERRRRLAGGGVDGEEVAARCINWQVIR